MGPFEQLLTQSSGPNVAPETLEMLGRQASQMFQSQGVPLNQAISQVLANHPELGNEHIKRIVEFANTVTFQEMFQNSEDKNVHFDVADPGVILRDLKDGGSPAHDGKTLMDYKSPPAQQQNSQLDAALTQSFMGSSSSGADDGQMKLASVQSVDHELHANPIEDAYDSQVRLQASRDKLAESYETMHGVFSQAQESLYQEVKNQVLDPDGAGLGGVVAALEKVAEPDLLEVIMLPITERLVKEGHQSSFLHSSLKKTAGAVPNLNHPLFAAVDAMLKVAGEMVTCGQAIDDLDKMLNDTSLVFKMAGALTTGVKKAMDAPGRVPAGVRQRFPKKGW